MQFIPTPVAAVILVALFALAGLLQTNAEPFGPGSGQPNGQTSPVQADTRIL